MKSTIFALIIIIIFTMPIICITGCSSYQTKYNERMTTMKKSKNYNGEIFVNTIPTKMGKDGTFWNTIGKLFSGDEIRSPEYKLEDFKTDIKKIKSTPANGLRITWMGHSTVFIEIDGKRFVTDPVWSKRTSPISWIGPARFFKIPIKLDDLPEIDGVIISHNHYDHLDSATIKELAKKNVMFYVPLAVGAHLESWGVDKKYIKEFDWWDELKLENNFKLVAVPARHYSGRGMFDRNETLWASWIIKSSNHNVYFGGDSGYSPDFKIIGDKYGPFDVTMLEIGAYDVNWPDIHMGPKLAVQAHLDLKGGALLPIHWGTFRLAFHTWNEPAEKIIKYAKEKNVKLLLPPPGSINNYPELAVKSYWWQKEYKNNKIKKKVALIESDK